MTEASPERIERIATYLAVLDDEAPRVRTTRTLLVNDGLPSRLVLSVAAAGLSALFFHDRFLGGGFAGVTLYGLHESLRQFQLRHRAKPKPSKEMSLYLHEQAHPGDATFVTALPGNQDYRHLDEIVLLMHHNALTPGKPLLARDAVIEPVPGGRRYLQARGRALRVDLAECPDGDYGYAIFTPSGTSVNVHRAGQVTDEHYDRARVLLSDGTLAGRAERKSTITQ